jgi:hypothetical protein
MSLAGRVNVTELSASVRLNLGSKGSQVCLYSFLRAFLRRPARPANKQATLN